MTAFLHLKPFGLEATLGSLCHFVHVAPDEAKAWGELGIDF